MECQLRAHVNDRWDIKSNDHHDENVQSQERVLSYL